MPGHASGIASLVDGAQQAYQAYCEMSGDEGGWTLVLKVDGAQGNFYYDNPLWTNTSGFQTDKPGLDTNEAKLPSYWNVAFTELRVGTTDGGQTRWTVLPSSHTSFLDGINKGSGTHAGRSAWEGILQSGSLQTKCNWEGFSQQGKVRLGMVGDESTLCGTFPSPDSFIGFGAPSGWGYPCGNFADGNYSPDNGGRSTKAFGYVMVR